jgi:SAM-dependent methyltransferase
MVVLDAGCGAGRHLCEAFRSRGVHVVGVDLKWEDLEKTRSLLCLMRETCDGHWLVTQGDVTRLPFRDGAFDAVICSEVLEHIPESRKAIEELVRVLKPGRPLAVSVPRFLPERICWALSRAYHNEPGGISVSTARRNSTDFWKRPASPAGASGTSTPSTPPIGGSVAPWVTNGKTSHWCGCIDFSWSGTS